MKYQKLYNLLIWKFIKNLVKIVEDEIMKLIIKKKNNWLSPESNCRACYG